MEVVELDEEIDEKTLKGQARNSSQISAKQAIPAERLATEVPRLSSPAEGRGYNI
jgi:hypothetical protein